MRDARFSYMMNFIYPINGISALRSRRKRHSGTGGARGPRVLDLGLSAWFCPSGVPVFRGQALTPMATCC